ncbi:hypothetical protein NEOLI_002570 [Neolecta irregularis DAH-3]|uniref:Uncharacterized protein n=1 Tax=Neolecta irregularis (strain DAH-3) TaxID=1198029 RepID=A0A1U7LQX4_NEOID|nr:hypothetical protein NEOLI_002570 [Neolecta irregularis DAH-3]|eukprot:OLL25057.1 hypothetical protein NEOLI_002570 [Neolecta irregularis DAH-3]
MSEGGSNPESSASPDRNSISPSPLVGSTSISRKRMTYLIAYPPTRTFLFYGKSPLLLLQLQLLSSPTPNHASPALNLELPSHFACRHRKTIALVVDSNSEQKLAAFRVKNGKEHISVEDMMFSVISNLSDKNRKNYEFTSVRNHFQFICRWTRYKRRKSSDEAGSFEWRFVMLSTPVPFSLEAKPLARITKNAIIFSSDFQDVLASISSQDAEITKTKFVRTVLILGLWVLIGEGYVDPVGKRNRTCVCF